MSLFLRYLTLGVLFAALSGCSSARFVQWQPLQNSVPGVSKSPMSESIRTSLLTQLATGRKLTQSQLRHCLTSSTPQPPDDWQRAIRLVCTHLWLGRIETDPQLRFGLIQSYNTQLEQLARLLYQQGSFAGNKALPGLTLSLQLPIDESGQLFSRYWFETELTALGYSRSADTPAGLGVPLAAYRANTGQGRDRWYPPEGIFRGVSLVLQDFAVDGPNLHLQIEGIYQQQRSNWHIGQNLYPLALDAGTAYLMLLEHADLDAISWSGLFDANKVEERLGIYLLEPYSPDKIPVLMIHGLNSNPYIWSHLSWRIFTRPDLAKRYQVWHAFYPSGPPPFFNAMRLRAVTEKLRHALSPALDDLAVNNMLLVGHSMGGIVARMYVTDSGDRLWKRTFTVKPDQLGLDPDSLAQVEDIFIFSARPYVKALVTLDTPHRGSAMAASTLGSVASAMVSLPGRFTGLFARLGGQLKQVLTGEMLPFLGDFGPNSIQVLAPGHPLMDELAAIPAADWVEWYSVVGNNTRYACPDDCERISDGVVPYASAHQPYAFREIVVPSEHDSYRHGASLDLIEEAMESVWRAAEAPAAKE